MTAPERPSYIAHWQEIERPDNRRYDGDDELMSIGAAFGRRFGLNKLGIHHERLPPGRRTSFPHAESAEEEFVYVIEGEPDVWLDGHLHRLKPGDGVGFPAGTGIAHSFLNNTDDEVRLLVVGERHKPENRIVYPFHPERQHMIDDWWDDHPQRDLGPHDGLPDRLRGSKARLNDE
ncbi:cupin domain-containing protein [Rhizobium sp. RCC_161_2]|uniref:cupin domain-containing protein n=1 Tax=Rhizobium sp. RCC_161_2 TaxID=3239219 RepID=UPI0035266AEA